MKKQIAVASIILSGMGVAVTHASAKADAGVPRPTWITTPCPTEDSNNCYWNADKQGNHKGHSFFSIRVTPSTCIVYWDDRYARHHNYCYYDTSVK